VFETFSGNEHLRQGCLTLERVRQLISDFVELRGDENLLYLDGLTLFSQVDTEDLPDALHPNPAGYIRMGNRFAEAVFSEQGILAQLND
jgi:lysophospholipase L1-like esterase